MSDITFDQRSGDVRWDEDYGDEWHVYIDPGELAGTYLALLSPTTNPMTDPDAIKLDIDLVGDGSFYVGQTEATVSGNFRILTTPPGGPGRITLVRGYLSVT